MPRTLLILCVAAAGLAAKDRAWQTGQLLDKNLNPYFRVAPASANTASSNTASFVSGDNGVLATNTRASEGDVSYDNYVVASGDIVYLVEFAHFKGFTSANVSVNKPVTFAIDKDKLIIRDLDRREFETKILKQLPKHGVALASAAPVAPPPPPPAKAEKPKPPTSKPGGLFATAAPASQDLNPPRPKPAPVPVKPVSAPPKPAPQPAPKVEAALVRSPEKPRPEGPVVRASLKDRAWQSGKLLSVASNNFFFNITYTSDIEGSSWPFEQGSDGRYTVTGHIADVTNSPYTYDNYVVESQFVAYLVQRMRPKSSPPVRLPGTQGLKFAVDKGKMWIVDDQGIEYETKVVKLVQKDAIVDPLARASAR